MSAAPRSSCRMARIILPGSLWRGLRPSGQGFLLPLKATRGWVLSSGITQLKFGQTALQWAAADPAGSSSSTTSRLFGCGWCSCRPLAGCLAALCQTQTFQTQEIRLSVPCVHAVGVLHASHMTTDCRVPGSATLMLMKNSIYKSNTSCCCCCRLNSGPVCGKKSNIACFYFKLQQTWRSFGKDLTWMLFLIGKSDHRDKHTHTSCI